MKDEEGHFVPDAVSHLDLRGGENRIRLRQGSHDIGDELGFLAG